MRIELKFRKTEARGLTWYLQQYYGSKASLETLAKQAVRDIAAIQAKKELDEAIKAVEEENLISNPSPNPQTFQFPS